jgi:hypothetical protein
MGDDDEKEELKRIIKTAEKMADLGGGGQA